MLPAKTSVLPFQESDSSVLLAFIYSDDETCAAALHRHARGTLSGASAGLLTVEGEGGQWAVPPGHAVWLPPHCMHSVQAHGPYSGWGAYIAEGACCTLPDSPRVVRTSGLLREAVARAASWRAGPRDSAQRRVAEVIFDEVRGLPGEPFDLPMPRDERLARVARAIVDDLADPLGLEAWAHAAGMAPRTLTRRFAAETGISLADWRQRARLLRAMARLAAGVPVNTVAIDLGYDNVSAFIAMFRRALGTTPGRYFAGGIARREMSPGPSVTVRAVGSQ